MRVLCVELTLDEVNLPQGGVVGYEVRVFAATVDHFLPQRAPFDPGPRSLRIRVTAQLLRSCGGSWPGGVADAVMLFGAGAAWSGAFRECESGEISDSDPDDDQRRNTGAAAGE